MITDDVDTILPCHARTDTKAQSNADGLSSRQGVYTEGGLLQGDYAQQAWFVLLCEYDRCVELQAFQPDGGFSYVDGDDSAVGILGG